MNTVSALASIPRCSAIAGCNTTTRFGWPVKAVLDSCALILTGLSGVRTFQARITFAMSRLAAVGLCRLFQLRPGISIAEHLPRNEFERLQAEVEDSGLRWSNPDDAEERLAAVRTTYESFLEALSRHLAVLAAVEVAGRGKL